MRRSEFFFFFFFFLYVFVQHPTLDNTTRSCTSMYSLRFKIKVMFGQKLRYEIKVTFGEFFPKLCQMNWNVARNDVNVVADELPDQITFYTCFKNWCLDSTASTHINVVLFSPVPSAQNGGLPVKLTPKVFNFTMDTPSAGKRLVRAMECTQFRAKSAKNDL
jgi:hypothetical protein